MASRSSLPPSRRISWSMLSSRLRSIVVEVEIQAAVALVRLTPPVLGLKAQIVGRLDLTECGIDLVLQVIVGRKPSVSK